MTQRSIDIRLMDRQYKVNCPVDQEAALQAAAARLNDKVQQITGGTRLSNPEQIAVMAALNLCHESAQHHAEQQQRIAELEQKIILLQATLEQVMSEQRPGR